LIIFYIINYCFKHCYVVTEDDIFLLILILGTDALLNFNNVTKNHKIVKVVMF